jgi:hypothetical protein
MLGYTVIFGAVMAYAGAIGYFTNKVKTDEQVGHAWKNARSFSRY